MAKKERVQKPKEPIFKRVWFWVLVVIIGAAAYGATNGSNTATDKTEATSTVPIDTITEWVQDSIGEGQSITSLSLEGRKLDIGVDLGDITEQYSGIDNVFAETAAQSITDTILDHEEFDNQWDEIIVHFDGIGHITLTKENIKLNEYDMRYMDILDNNGNSLFITE